MQAPDKPADETTRLETLRALSVLDTASEERFDRLTRLARRLFGVPIALVSLVDENRQWFKSRLGLNAPQTPRNVSFCGHAILGDDILLVPDAARDPRFHDNPLVTGNPWIRFYAGCPLRVNGSKLGTLCLIDRTPRELAPEDLALLRDLSRMAEQELATVQLATMDDLTMISNRRGFEALARHALGLCRRLQRPASLMFFDLDLFKQINDRFGHAEGDHALQQFTRLLAQTFRESDVLGRLGGDEFAVLLTNTDEAQCRIALDRLRVAVGRYNRTTARGYDVVYSVGAVKFDAARHADVTRLMAEAGALMYAHKQRRRAGHAHGGAGARGETAAHGEAAGDAAGDAAAATARPPGVLT